MYVVFPFYFFCRPLACPQPARIGLNPPKKEKKREVGQLFFACFLFWLLAPCFVLFF
jgi:hypothetical protein